MTIPSLKPVGDAIAADNRARSSRGLAARAINGPAIQGLTAMDPDSGLNIMALGDLLEQSGKIRYVDFPSMDYRTFVGGERSNGAVSPLSANGKKLWPAGTGEPTVHVIGMGLGGLACAWQLAKVGAKVTCFEAGPAPTTATTGAGRIAPVLLNNDPNLAGEFGAMRFPDTSHLFWHYLRLAKGGADGGHDDAGYMAFPNPGAVPTLFAGESKLYANWPAVGFNLPTSPVLDSGIDYGKLQSRHLAALITLTDPATGKTLGDITTLCTSGTMTATDEVTVQTFWENIRRKYYSTTYRSFLVAAGFTPAEIDVIGYLGLGTGGFKPMFDVCVLDMLRLIPWNYANEFTVSELGILPKYFYDQMKGMSNVDLNAYGVAVEGVFFSRDTKKYVLFGRYVAGPSAGKTFCTGGVDYVVFAMSNKAAARLIQSTAVSLSTAAPWCTNPVRVHSSDIPQGGLGGLNSICNDIVQQGSMSAVKIFQVVAGPATPYRPAGNLAFPSLVATEAQNPYNLEQQIRVIYGKPGTAPLGVTYFLPYGNQSFKASQKLLRLHYAWGPDARSIRSNLLNVAPFQPSVKADLDARGKAFFADMFWKNGLGVLNTALGSQLSKPGEVTRIAQPLPFIEYSAPYRVALYMTEPLGEGQFAIVDWDSFPYVYMGFKLDAPGRGMQSIHSYKALALSPETAMGAAGWFFVTTPSGYNVHNTVLHPAAKRCHFCGDSFSQMGGWIEGAFQSALATSSSICYDALTVRGMSPQAQMSPMAQRQILNAPDPYTMGVF